MGRVVVRVISDARNPHVTVPPRSKYQKDGGPGIGEVADLLGRLDLSDRARSREGFFDGLAYNVAIQGTDAHAKNYSLLLAGGRATLAPLYDVSSAAPYAFDTPAESALKIGEHWVMREISESDWVKTARRLGIAPDWALGRVTALRRQVAGAFQAEADALPASLQDRGHAIASAVERHVAQLPSVWGA